MAGRRRERDATERGADVHRGGMVAPRGMDAEDAAANGKKADKAEKDTKAEKMKKDKKKEETELSEEDAQLKENLELMVERLADVDHGVVNLALVTLMYAAQLETRAGETVPYAR